MSIKAILFDFIGTTVIEKDSTLLNRCFVEAFADYDVTVDVELIKANRGKDKKDMVAHILNEVKAPQSSAEDILKSFKTHLEHNLDNFYANEGATETFRLMKENKIKIGLGTGLPRDTFEKIFHHLGWDSLDFDYIGIAEETGRGRPHPDMILDMMKKLKLNKTELLKVGDTVADILEGKNAGVMTAAILSGTQDEKEILGQKPDYVIRSLKELLPTIGLQSIFP